MARFAGKETDLGSQLLGRLLTFLILVLVILGLLAWWHPLWAHDLLATLGLWDLATGGIGR
jgi:hypothetical protein